MCRYPGNAEEVFVLDLSVVCMKKCKSYAVFRRPDMSFFQVLIPFPATWWQTQIHFSRRDLPLLPSEHPRKKLPSPNRLHLHAMLSCICEIGFRLIVGSNCKRFQSFPFFFSLLSLVWKNKESKLVWSLCCLCIPHINFWMPESVFMKLGMYIMAH
jgi:hypothetical protein